MSTLFFELKSRKSGHLVSSTFGQNSLVVTPCYEKAGFRKEGLLRDSAKIGDEYWSSREMSILENEWLKIRSV